MSVIEKAKKHTVYERVYFDGRFVVESGTSGKMYKIDEHAGYYYCNCAWGESHPGERACSHVVAVQNYIGRKRVVDSLNEEDTPTAVVSGITVHPDGSVEVKYR
jgi:hypothetical protein